MGYELAMESFKTKAKKMDLGEYYYHFLNIPVTSPYMSIPSKEGGEEKESGSSGDEDGHEATSADAGGEDQ